MPSKNFSRHNKYLLKLLHPLTSVQVTAMAKHQADLVRCSRQPAPPSAASARPTTAAASPATPWWARRAGRVCDGCSGGGGGHGSRSERCLVCGAGAGEGGAAAVADAYYCRSCVQMEKDRDGCPAVVNAGTARRDSAAFFFSARSKRGGFRSTMA